MQESTCNLMPLQQRLTFGKSEVFESATSLEEKASSIVSSCRICLSTILNPASLTCGHRFCEKCLDQYWRIREKPQFIVCPLCRSNAFKVDFAKKEEDISTESFRKVFNPLQNINDSDYNQTVSKCLKFSLIMPAVYWFFKWLKIPVIDLFTAIQTKFMAYKLGK